MFSQNMFSPGPASDLPHGKMTNTIVTVFLLISKIKQKRLRAGFNFTLFNRDLNLPDEWS